MVLQCHYGKMDYPDPARWIIQIHVGIRDMDGYIFFMFPIFLLPNLRAGMTAKWWSLAGCQQVQTPYHNFGPTQRDKKHTTCWLNGAWDLGSGKNVVYQLWKEITELLTGWLSGWPVSGLEWIVQDYRSCTVSPILGPRRWLFLTKMFYSLTWV